MTLWQTYEQSGWNHIKAEIAEDYLPYYYQWDDYDFYNYCESGMLVDHLEILKEMNT